MHDKRKYYVWTWFAFEFEIQKKQYVEMVLYYNDYVAFDVCYTSSVGMAYSEAYQYKHTVRNSGNQYVWKHGFKQYGKHGSPYFTYQCNIWSVANRRLNFWNTQHYFIHKGSGNHKED